MEGIRSWIINICTTVFFITAVEMILPDNNLKKYSKFVLGLILMTVIINPLVKFLNQGAEVTAFINTSNLTVQENYEKNVDNLKEKSINDTLSVFKMNLEKTCEKKFKERYPKDKFKVEAQVQYDEAAEQYIINHISVGVNNNGVDKVQKVEIKTNGNIGKNNEDVSKYGLEVKDYLSNVLELPREKITVYKLAK